MQRGKASNFNINHKVLRMEKINHHFIPRHWLKRFRGDDGNLWVRDGDEINVRGVDAIMAIDYLYTVYDKRFSGSDSLEDELSRIETTQSQSLMQICRTGEPVGPGTRHDLAAIIALQTLRHPDVMAWGRRRALRFAELVLKIKRMSLDEFLNEVAPVLDDAHPEWVYEEIQSRTEADLEKELADIKALSPQNPELAETNTLSALTSLCASLHEFHMRVLEIREGEGSFVLGDTPVPQEKLASGFTVPLSKRVAVVAWRKSNGNPVSIERSWANPDEIVFVNQAQWNRHARLIVGESREVLRALPPSNWGEAT